MTLRVVLVLLMAGCGASKPAAAYGAAAAVCTAEKQRIIETAATPPSEVQQARFETTHALCERILFEIEAHADE